MIIHIGTYTSKWAKQWQCGDDVFIGLLMTSPRCQNRPIHYPVSRRMQMIKDNSNLPLETTYLPLSRRYSNIKKEMWKGKIRADRCQMNFDIILSFGIYRKCYNKSLWKVILLRISKRSTRNSREIKISIYFITEWLFLSFIYQENFCASKDTINRVKDNLRLCFLFPVLCLRSLESCHQS